MNSLFISGIISEISLLQKISVNHINEEIKRVKKDIKENKLLLEYSDILDKIVENGKPSVKNVNKFLNKKYKEGKVSDYIDFEKTNDESFKINFKINDNFFSPKNVIIIRNNIMLKLEISNKNAIINLISLYEKFLRQLIFYDCQDNCYKIIENEQINLALLLNMNFCKDNIINHIQEQYCNDKLRGENKKIAKIISIFGIDCNDEKNLINEFDEIYYRRNIYVHSLNSITNDYKSLPEEIKKRWIDNNNKLINNSEYFNNAFDVTTKILLLIIIKYCLFKKQSQKDLDTIMNLVYDEFYIKKRTKMALFCYNQLKKISWISPLDRYEYFVNYMVCLKRLKHPDLELELNKWKPDTDADIFKLAKKLIANDYTNINNLIKKLLTKENSDRETNEEEFNTLTLKEIDEWPLFEEYIKTKYYQELKKDFLYHY